MYGIKSVYLARLLRLRLRLRAKTRLRLRRPTADKATAEAEAEAKSQAKATYLSAWLSFAYLLLCFFLLDRADSSCEMARQMR